MAQITVSQRLFQRIKDLADPFVDTTPESVIARCVEFYVSNHGGAKQTPALGDEAVLPFSGEVPPSLTFTKPTGIRLDGREYPRQRLYWNLLLFDVVRKAAGKLSPEKLRQNILVNYVEGEGPQAQGYRHVTEAGLSVQGQDANAAWRAAFHLIKAAGLSIEITFMWEHKDKAAHPGKVGRMTHQP